LAESAKVKAEAHSPGLLFQKLSCSYLEGNASLADAPWNDRPALDLLREYLATLAQVVAEVEVKFGPGAS